MNLKLVSILGAVVASFTMTAHLASASGWSSEQLKTVVTVSSTSDAAVYRVSTVVTDVPTSKVVGRPVLLVGASQPASFEIGTTQPGSILKVVVNVDADGLNANYRIEMIVDGQVVSTNSDRLRVQRGA